MVTVLGITIIAFQGTREHKHSMFLIWKACEYDGICQW